MADYYTRDEWCEMLQAKLGTQVSTTNKRFPPDACLDAIMRQVHGWQPWLPADFQDSNTESVIQVQAEWSLSGGTYYSYVALPAYCARLMGLDISNTTDQHFELYGMDKGAGGLGDYNAYVDRKQRLKRRNIGIRLFCKVGRVVYIYPTLTAGECTSMYFDLNMRFYVTEPLEGANLLDIPKLAVPFHLSGAAVDGKWADLREGAAQAMQSEFFNQIKLVFGVKDREAQES